MHGTGYEQRGTYASQKTRQTVGKYLHEAGERKITETQREGKRKTKKKKPNKGKKEIPGSKKASPKTHGRGIA